MADKTEPTKGESLWLLLKDDSYWHYLPSIDWLDSRRRGPSRSIGKCEACGVELNDCNWAYYVVGAKVCREHDDLVERRERERPSY